MLSYWGAGTFSPNLDEGHYIGVAWSDDHKSYLLVCSSPNGDTLGEYKGCNENGVFQKIQVCS